MLQSRPANIKRRSAVTILDLGTARHRAGGVSAPAANGVEVEIDPGLRRLSRCTALSTLLRQPPPIAELRVQSAQKVRGAAEKPTPIARSA